MKFQFKVNLSDKDYLDYNMFWMIKSPYGKKQILTFRVTLAILLGVFIFITLYGGGFTAESFIGAIPMLIVLLVFELFLTRFFKWTFKWQIKSLKKSGKMGYSPESVIEFYDDVFVEKTSENKTEQKYSAIERISIVDKRKIYIHINNVMAYILPLSCFESKEQYDSFFEFISLKCRNIDVY